VCCVQYERHEVTTETTAVDMTSIAESMTLVGSSHGDSCSLVMMPIMLVVTCVSVLGVGGIVIAVCKFTVLEEGWNVVLDAR
jgi:hypothetical protein